MEVSYIPRKKILIAYHYTLSINYASACSRMYVLHARYKGKMNTRQNIIIIFN